MLRGVLLILATLAASSAVAQPTLMVFGDSLSAAYGMGREEGWVSLLAHRVQEAGYPHEIVNASISGDTTAGGRNRLAEALSRHRPDVVVIELGGNDGLRGVPLTATRENLQAMISEAQSQGAQVMLIGVTLPPNYGAGFNDRFAALYQDLAREEDLPLAMLSLSDVAEEAGMIQDDGLHPTAAAQPRILETVWPKLEPLLGMR